MMMMILRSRNPRGEGRGRDGDKQTGEKQSEVMDAIKGSYKVGLVGHRSPPLYRGLGLRLQGRLGIGGRLAVSGNAA